MSALFEGQFKIYNNYFQTTGNMGKGTEGVAAPLVVDKNTEDNFAKLREILNTKDDTYTQKTKAELLKMFKCSIMPGKILDGFYAHNQEDKNFLRELLDGKHKKTFILCNSWGANQSCR